MINKKLDELRELPCQYHKGIKLIGFNSEEQDNFIPILDKSLEGLNKVNVSDCYLDHNVLNSGIQATPVPLMAYSVQNGFDSIEGANSKRNEKWGGRFGSSRLLYTDFDPSPEVISILDEEIKIYESEINKLMQVKRPNWEREMINPNLPWAEAAKLEQNRDWYGIKSGLDFLDFYLQISPYDSTTGLADLPVLKEIIIRNPQSYTADPLGVITDRDFLDQLPLTATFSSWGHILEPSKEGLTIYNKKY